MVSRFLLSKKYFIGLNPNIYIFFVSLVLFIAITNGNFWEYDSQTVFRLTQSMVDKGSFSIDCFLGSSTYKGKCFSEYGLFMSIVIVPFYLIDKLFLEGLKSTYFYSGFFPSLTNAFITALLSVLIFNFLLKLKFTTKQSFLGSIFFSFFTYAVVYTKTLFSEPLSALLIYLGLYLILFKKESKYVYVLIGLLLGLSILTRITNILYLPLFIILGYHQKATKKSFLEFTVAFGFSITVLFIYNYIRFENIFNSGYRGIKFDYPFLNGLYLHLFSLGKSIFLYQPFVIIGLLGIKYLFFLNKRVLYSFAYIFIINLLFYSFYMHPAGDLTWGDRYLYPVIFILVILSVFFFVYGKNLILKRMFIGLLAISLLIQISAIFISYHRYYNSLSYSYQGKFIDKVHYQPHLSPLIGQWKVILNKGLSSREIREAFTEHIGFNSSYKIASPDMFLLRSKRELPIFLILVLIEFLLLINYKRFLQVK